MAVAFRRADSETLAARAAGGETASNKYTGSLSGKRR
jgi:hypothetical protein